MERVTLIAFGELFLKSEGVRNLFIRKLKNNLEALSGLKVVSFRERMVMKGEYKGVKRVPGIAWYADAFYFKKTSLKEFSRFIEENYQSWIKKGETFALKVSAPKREEVISKVAEKIKRKVDLDRPDRTLFIEVRSYGWFLYFKKNKGERGLPVGSSGKVLSLFSGGIDSPVSSYLISKRGAENVWIHFHSFPLVSNKSIEKTREMGKIFLKYQPSLKIYFSPFHFAQTEIKAKVPPNYRVMLYRRLMLMTSEAIAEKEGCKALVTGESLGQVSSQTLSNISITNSAASMPILRPVIGMGKEEIIKTAKKIGSYNISIKPQEDCCTLFVPKHASAEGKMERIKELEKEIGVKKIIRKILKETTSEFFD